MVKTGAANGSRKKPSVGYEANCILQALGSFWSGTNFFAEPVYSSVFSLMI